VLRETGRQIIIINLTPAPNEVAMLIELKPRQQIFIFLRLGEQNWSNTLQYINNQLVKLKKCAYNHTQF
jgi:hypothetical protein